MPYMNNPIPAPCEEPSCCSASVPSVAEAVIACTGILSDCRCSAESILTNLSGDQLPTPTSKEPGCLSDSAMKNVELANCVAAALDQIRARLGC